MSKLEHESPQISNRKLFLDMFSRLKEVQKHSFYIYFLLFLSTIYLIGEPYIYMRVIDIIIGASLHEKSIVINLILLIVGWGTLGFIGLSSWALYQYSVWKYMNIDSRDWGVELGRKFLNLPVSYHINTNTGELQKVYDKGDKALWEIGDMFYIRFLPTILLFFGILILAIYTNIWMTLASLAPLPFIGYFLYKFGETASKIQRTISNLWDRVLSRFSDALVNIRIIKIFSRMQQEYIILKSNYENAMDKQVNNNIRWAIVESSFEIFQFLVKLILLSIGISLILKGELSVGALILFLTIVGRIYSPVLNLINTYKQYTRVLSDYLKAYTIYQYTSEGIAEKDKPIFGPFTKNITFQNLSFSYPSSPREVLSDINFEIKKGERVAFIGHTGSGKSTITQLLMRFYEPTQGKILIDGTDIYDYTLESYRQKFAAVFQDTTLFNETIRHNLEYVRDGITDADIEKACREANILDFIESLPEKWETQVGERGLKLSGGEKQRIAIARAILANPEILILDEATSALDTKTEKLVQSAFDHLMEGRTSIIIAHRLSTIMGADTIYLMEKGKIVAKGSHVELYRASKDYKEMVDLQHDGFVGEDEEEEKITAL